MKIEMQPDDVYMNSFGELAILRKAVIRVGGVEVGKSYTFEADAGRGLELIETDMSPQELGMVFLSSL